MQKVFWRFEGEKHGGGRKEKAYTYAYMKTGEGDDTPSPHATVRVVIFIIYILKQYGKDACAAAPNKYEKETI